MDSSSGQCNQDNDTSKYDEEDSLDPRIQVILDLVAFYSYILSILLFYPFKLELEKLNSATDNINKLEIELDVSICVFKLIQHTYSSNIYFFLYLLKCSILKIIFLYKC